MKNAEELDKIKQVIAALNVAIGAADLAYYCWYDADEESVSVMETGTPVSQRSVYTINCGADSVPRTLFDTLKGLIKFFDKEE